MNDYDEGARMNAALGTLARYVSERWRRQLEGLRVALDQQISSIEATLDESDDQPVVQAAIGNLRHVTAARAEHARLQAEAIAAQGLAAIKAELNARLDSVLKENQQLKTAMGAAQAQLLDVHAQCQQLASANQKMTTALSEMLPSSVAAPASAPKKPLQFSEPARDAKRVKIRRGIQVSIDGVTGELVDLSIGGAQALLTQAVRPNQLIRLTIPRAEGQVTCKGRIVWAVREQPATSLSVYRTGMKFTEVDTAAVDNVMNDYAERPTFGQSRPSSGVA